MSRLAEPPGQGSLMSKPDPKAKKSIPVRTVGPFRACDECGYAHDGGAITRAKHQVDVIGGTLYFCNHHFADHALVFIAANYRCIRV